MAITENRRIRGFLKRVIGEGVGSIIPLIEKAYTVGRDRRCGIWFDDVNVSRKHCALQQTALGWTITDCGGINGTYLNGNRLESKVPAPLEDGNVIFLGSPESTTYGFLFLKTIGLLPSATIVKSDSSKAPRPASPSFETRIRGSPFKRGTDSHASGTDANKLFKTDSSVSSSVSCNTPRPCEEPTPGPSFLGECSSTGGSSQTVQIIPNRLTSVSRHNKPIQIRWPEICEAQNLINSSVRANRLVAMPPGIKPILRSLLVHEPSDSREDKRFSNFATAANMPHSIVLSPRKRVQIVFPRDRDSVDAGDVSDCSISSLDSLKTRIRKKQKRESQNFSRSHQSKTSTETAHTSKEELDDCSHPSSTQKLLTMEKASFSGGNDLRSEKMAESRSCLLDSDYEDSESLLPVQLPDDVYQASNSASHVEKQLNKSTEDTKTVDQESTIQYLKERVLKLQKNLLEAKGELKSVNLENQNQKQLIEVLKSSQGISHDQLIKVLDDELCCNICTEIFIKPTTLSCAHTFCEHCISVWKKKKKQCPMCREPITTETTIMVLDNLINRAVEYLDESHRARRLELIQTRIEEKVKMNKKPKRRLASRRRRNSQIRIQRIANNLPATSPTQSVEHPLQLLDLGHIAMVPRDIYDSTSRPFASGIEIQISDDSDSSSVEGAGYYGGFGRCYNCGRRGHWANGCPD